MGKMQRDKGARRERQIVDLFLGMGIKSERVPLSGAVTFRDTRKTDVDFYPLGPDSAPWLSEVKARASGGGFKQINTWLGDGDALFLIEDRKAPLVVLPWPRFASLLEAIRGHKRYVRPAKDLIKIEDET